MFKYVLFAALVAVAYGGAIPLASLSVGGPLPAVLTPKINIAPTKLTVVKQPVTVEQTEHVYRSVPVPIRAVAYSAPQIIAPAVAHTTLIAAPQAYISSPVVTGHQQIVW